MCFSISSNGSQTLILLNGQLTHTIHMNMNLEHIFRQRGIHNSRQLVKLKVGYPINYVNIMHLP